MKPRVLLVNKFYYRRGGDCVCVLNLERMLRERGHEVAVFAMQYPENLPSEWSSYWPEEVSFAGGIGGKLSAMGRTLGVGDVVRNFKRLLRDFKPDVVHLHNVHSYLSPVVGRLAHDAGARVVWTLHDYKLGCPSYSCLRDGRPCELCFTDKKQVLLNRCMKGSLAGSGLAYAEALRWNAGRLSGFTDRFICPSAFMARKMAAAGFDSNRLEVLCNFISDDSVEAIRAHAADAAKSADQKPYYCYVGRLSDEKGVDTLLQAAAELPYELLVAGDGPLADELKSRYRTNTNIRFLGRLDGKGVASLLASARLSVLPSECYENNPLGIIESLCAGTPVVGAAIGGIPELIDESSGRTFASGSKDELKEAIREVWEGDFDRASIAANAQRRFSADAYYPRLLELYTK